MIKKHTRVTARTKTPIFDAMIEEARRSPKDTDIGHEELGRRLGITDTEQQAAQATVDRWLWEDAAEEAQAHKADDSAAGHRPPKARSHRQAPSH